MNALLSFLCLVGIHQVPAERRRATAFGWYGHCLRCGRKATGR